MEDDKDLPYTIFEKVPGKPQLLKLAPLHPPKEEDVALGPQFPLAGTPIKYPLG